MCLCYGIDYKNTIVKKLCLLFIIDIIILLTTFCLVFSIVINVENKLISISTATIILSLGLIISYQSYKYGILILLKRIKFFSYKIVSFHECENCIIEFVSIKKELGLTYYLYKVNNDIYESNISLDIHKKYSLRLGNRYILGFEEIKNEINTQ